MPCLVNTKTGSIHDASKKHTEKFSGTHFEIVDTLPEAKAKVKSCQGAENVSKMWF